MMRLGNVARAVALGVGACSTHAVAKMQEDQQKSYRILVRDSHGRIVMISPEHAQHFETSQAFGRAEALMQDPPPLLQRYGNAWRAYAPQDQIDYFQSKLRVLEESLANAKSLGRSTMQLDVAVQEAEAAVREVQASAIHAAAAAPWSKFMRGLLLEPARGGSQAYQPPCPEQHVPHFSSGARTHAGGARDSSQREDRRVVLFSWLVWPVPSIHSNACGPVQPYSTNHGRAV